MARKKVRSARGKAIKDEGQKTSRKPQHPPAQAIVELKAANMTLPEAVSDDGMESDGPDAIPARGEIPTRAAAVEEPEDDDDDDEDDEDDDEDDDDDDAEEFRVEKILGHDFDEDGSVLYQIKWLGYERKSDLTWEPVENLENAKDFLKQYHHQIGGTPELKEPGPNPGKGKGKDAGKSGADKRTANAAFSEPQAGESSTTKRVRRSPVGVIGAAPINGTHDHLLSQLPQGSWEDDILRISSIIEDVGDNANNGKAKQTTSLNGLVEWVNGWKATHKMDVLRRKCPQKLLDYYEQHIVFRPGNPADDAVQDDDDIKEE